MGLKKLTEKISDYNERLERGKANKIKPGDVEKVLEKLRAKEAELAEDLERTEDPEHTERLTRKRAVARQQIERAEWLIRQLD